MRLGRHHPDEIERLLPVMDRYPIESITIHPRTGIQMYSGKPDLDTFERCLPLTRHRVVYNGDIVSREGFEALQERFPQIDHWMIGRGIMADPFLPAIIKGMRLDDESCIRRFSEFHRTLFARYEKALYGPSHLLDRMKGLWTYFSDGFQNGSAFRKKVHKTQNVEHYWDVIERFFDSQAVWRGGSSLPYNSESPMYCGRLRDRS